MTAISQAKEELSNLKEVTGTAIPHLILERSVIYCSILASVNSEMAAFESAYHQQVKQELVKGSVAAAEHIAMADISYVAFREAKGISKALEKAITALQRFAQSLSDEMHLTK